MSTQITTIALGNLWGERVAERRRLLGLSQAMFAELVGTTQQTISRVENGQLVPHDRLKVQIAQRSGSTVAEMFGWPKGRIELAGAA